MNDHDITRAHRKKSSIVVSHFDRLKFIVLNTQMNSLFFASHFTKPYYLHRPRCQTKSKETHSNDHIARGQLTNNLQQTFLDNSITILFGLELSRK